MEMSLKYLRKLGLPFPDWHATQEIGSGTFGSVYRIESRQGEICALKVIPVPSSSVEMLETMQNCGNDPVQARAAFDATVQRILKREIGTAKQCAGSPNVFRIYEEAVVDDPENPVQRYIMVRMELLMECKSFLHQQETRQRDVLRMMENIASALAYMEGRNILHRDIKPANIMVDSQGLFKLTDFGEARVVQQEASHTIARGTPYYMAPEVATSGHYDNRADIYSLGMVAYYFLNGMRYPFAQNGLRAREGYERRMRGDPCPAIRRVDRRVNSIILRCVAFRPEERYSRAVELLSDLRELLRDPSVGTELLNAPGSASGGSVSSRSGGGMSGRPGNGNGGGLSTTAIVLIVLGGVTLFILLAVLVTML